MKIKEAFRNSALALLLLLLLPVSAAFSQDRGTSPQQGTSSQNSTGAQRQAQAPTPALENSGPGQETPAVGATQSAPLQPGIGNTQTVASRNVPWGWLILGFFIGLLAGALAWRRPVTI